VVADLLPDRSAASFAKWLQEHPKVSIISRDRDGVYAEAGYAGAPRAKQVAERFHLVQSLMRAMQEELAHQRGRLLIPAEQLLRHGIAREASEGVTQSVGLQQRRGPRPSFRQKEIRQQRRQQKVALFEMVKGLQVQGMRAFEIVNATGISRGRVDKWLRLTECRRRTRWRRGLAWRNPSAKNCGGGGNEGAGTEESCSSKCGSWAISEATRD
jgi:hypothetical protein